MLRQTDFLLLRVRPPTAGAPAPISRVSAATEGADTLESRPVDRRNFLAISGKSTIGLPQRSLWDTASFRTRPRRTPAQRAPAAPGLVYFVHPKHRWRRPPSGRHGAAAISARAPGNCSILGPGLGRPIWPYCNTRRQLRRATHRPRRRRDGRWRSPPRGRGRHRGPYARAKRRGDAQPAH